MPESTTSLPSGHPPVEIHAHNGQKCSIAGETHAFCPPQSGDLRSVCPALNTMANHGYIPRDGKNLTFNAIRRGLQQCYNLSFPLAAFLTFGGFFLLKRVRPLDLHLIGKHLAVEHDASLVHRDTPAGETYAPPEIVEAWVPDIINAIEPRVEGMSHEDVLVNEEDVGRMRIRREKLSPKLDAMHAEIARGEMAIIIGVWEKKGVAGAGASAKTGAPLPYLLNWLGNERLPEGWKPDHVQGILDVIRRSKIMRETMAKIREAETQEAKAK